MKIYFSKQLNGLKKKTTLVTNSARFHTENDYGNVNDLNYHDGQKE